MMSHELSPAQEQILRDQVISEVQPGAVLHDFQVLLDFLSPNGVEAGGKYNLIPIKFIGELDRRLSRPLNLKLQRPQIRSHPYLQGLNLLLRASGLVRVEGAGAKTRLLVDPVMRLQWDQLNPTERYFNLLEAGLRIGRPEMVGESGGGAAAYGLLSPCLGAWQSTPEKGRKLKSDKLKDIYIPGIARHFYILALMDLFGLIAVQPPRAPVTTWYPSGIQRIPFGDAMMTLLRGKLFDGFSEDAEEEDDETIPVLRFGVWQPTFQPFFPEWRRNLEFPDSERREGLFVFRVSLDKVWRLIAMPFNATLDELADFILDSVDFDDKDHLFEFTYRDRLGGKASVFHPEMDEGPWADQKTVGELPLEPGQTMTFVFDFGDNWKFTVKLERIEPSRSRQRPRIIERHGKAPPQYPDWDE
jgi:hypothetical protein